MARAYATVLGCALPCKEKILFLEVESEDMVRNTQVKVYTPSGELVGTHLLLGSLPESVHWETKCLRVKTEDKTFLYSYSHLIKVEIWEDGEMPF